MKYKVRLDQSEEGWASFGHELLHKQGHEAVGACFRRNVVVFVRKPSLVKNLQSIARRLLAPQMGSSVRQPPRGS